MTPQWVIFKKKPFYLDFIKLFFFFFFFFFLNLLSSISFAIQIFFLIIINKWININLKNFQCFLNNCN